MARFHTSTGVFVGWRHLPNGVRAIGQAVIRKVFGRLPREPWIPFRARNELASILTRDAVVWEVGAGYSTLWLAAHVGQVVSIEASKEWHDRLAAIIRQEGIANVDLRHEWQADRMADFSGVEDGSLDLLFIDGGPRGLCLANGFRKVKSGGHVYLDNWDSRHFWDAETDFPERRATEIRRRLSCVDYVPAQFGVYEGLLLQKARSARSVRRIAIRVRRDRSERGQFARKGEVARQHAGKVELTHAGEGGGGEGASRLG